MRCPVLFTVLDLPGLAESGRIAGISAAVSKAQAWYQPPAPTMYVPIAQVNDGIIALNNRIGTTEWLVRTRLQRIFLEC
jgi:hypothetical protein